MAEMTLVKKLEELISDAKKADDFLAKEKALQDELVDTKRLLQNAQLKAKELEDALKWERVAFDDRKQQLATERESTARAEKHANEVEEKLEAADKEKNKLIMRIRELESDDSNVGKLRRRLREAKEDLEEMRRTLRSFQGDARPAFLAAAEAQAEDHIAPADVPPPQEALAAEAKNLKAPVPLGKCSKNPNCMVQNDHDGECLPWVGTKTGRFKASEANYSNPPKMDPATEVKT